MTQKIRQDVLVASDLEVEGGATFNGAVTIAGALTLTGTIAQAGRQLWVPASLGQIGATAGWAVAEDGGLARVPASQTASTFTIPLIGLEIGDIVNSVSVVGQAESAGNNVSLTISVRKQTLAAADFADSQIATATTGNLTADTAISPDDTSLTATLGTAETLAIGEHLYALLTATSAASTDLAVAGLIVNYDRS